MKLSNTMVSAIMIGAALVSAYAIGLLIRHVRTGARPVAPAVAEANEAAVRRPDRSASPTKDTAAERARVKEKKEKTLEMMGSLTKEEREQFKDKVIKQVGGRRGGKGPGGLAPEERQARKTKTRSPSPAVRETPDANGPTSPQGSTDSRQSAEKAGTTP
jgi:hypothetical protein